LGRHSQHHFTANLFRGDGQDTANLIPDAEFVALLTAVRIVYAKSERTNFNRVANLLSRVGQGELLELVAQFRQNWAEIPQRPILFDLSGEHFRPKDLVETWMNGEVFHQDEDQIRRMDLLRDAGPFAEMILQLTVRDLCFAILGLDNACAVVLGEPFRPVPAHDPHLHLESDGDAG
jgi:hypothetical protein